MNIRSARPGDCEHLAAIYGHHVVNGFGTFEEDAPGPAEMADRLAAVTARGLPYLVAELDGAVKAFAYAAPFRLRAAYRHTVEDSVYVAPGCERRGLGRRLLQAVIADCERLGLRQMLALIGDSGNAASRRLHAACGFAEVGLLGSVGFKTDRFVDVVVMQRALGAGAACAPQTPGLTLGGR